jgi:hypothetical protein
MIDEQAHAISVDYRQMTHVNLPDAHVGHAVLDIGEAVSRLKTFIR